jgi:hypothetical protein
MSDWRGWLAVGALKLFERRLDVFIMSLWRRRLTAGALKPSNRLVDVFQSLAVLNPLLRLSVTFPPSVERRGARPEASGDESDWEW